MYVIGATFALKIFLKGKNKTQVQQLSSSQFVHLASYERVFDVLKRVVLQI